MGRPYTEGSATEAELKAEVERLKLLAGLGQEIKVVWRPCLDSSLSGEVRGNDLIIYETDEKEALKTLRHEFIDFIVSQAVEPYKEVANILVKQLNKNAYQNKEFVVEALCRLMFEGGEHN